MSDRNNTKDAAYQYDPLDRLTKTHSTLRFYNGTRIATEIQEERKTSFFENGSIPLAELHPDEAAILLATDVQASVLHRTRPALNQTMTYDPYGHHQATDDLHGAQGFNGQQPDEMTGHYLLGQGYRAFNPVLMRFNSPDNKSPFGSGGINVYTYCQGDPINKRDDDGHSAFFTQLIRVFRSMRKSVTRTKTKLSKPQEEMQLIGFHGTNNESAKNITKNGLASKSKSDSFFVSNTFENVKAYSGSNGSVLAVYTKNMGDFSKYAVRGQVKGSGIPQLKIPKEAQSQLNFKIIQDTDVSVNFNRFMDEKQSTQYWIKEFRKR